MRTRSRQVRFARPRGAFTLVELAIAVTIMILLLAAAGRVLLAGSRAFRVGQARDSLLLRARRTLDRIADPIAMAGLSKVTPVPAPPFGNSTIDVQVPTGYASNAVTLGTTTRIQWQIDPKETANGIDDDRDGLVDEGQVVMISDVGLATQRSVVLARNVAAYLEGETANNKDDNGNGLIDERGLSFVLNGERLTIRLTIQGRDSEGKIAVRTVETTVKLRN